MARIRSVHPSLFTDERWVSCSPIARVFYIGLLTVADDQGLFEWKPLTLRMQVLPGDSADIGELLAELVSVDLIQSLESAGKKLGAIRYFRRFQRPKKPNSVFVLPPEMRTYVGLSTDGSELPDDDECIVQNQFRTGGENRIQMEDGGGRREDGKKVSDANASSVAEPGDDVRLAIDLWNELAERAGLPLAEKHTDARRKALKARLRDGGLEAWRAALKAVEVSKLCCGDTERGWRADIDFVCQPKSWARLQEGFYGKDRKPTARARPPLAPRWAGPTQTREAVVAEKGEEFAVSWLDPASWSDDGTITAKTVTAAKELRRLTCLRTNPISNPPKGAQ